MQYTINSSFAGYNKLCKNDIVQHRDVSPVQKHTNRNNTFHNYDDDTIDIIVHNIIDTYYSLFNKFAAKNAGNSRNRMFGINENI